MTFLVDVNLPEIFPKSNADNFIYVFNVDRELSDSEIWKLALKENYIILTRDMDFYHRAKESIEFPKIVIFRFGNLKLKQMKNYFHDYWSSIYELIIKTQLIFAWQNELEVIF
jgi:predicted nuclease of predicted toxin-antitoxin system